jgi:HPt (histidine-containing phosphotransfer) domain-containing protein
MTVPLPSGGHAAAGEATIDPAVFDELRALGEAAEEDFLADLVDQFVHDTEPLLVELSEALELGDARAVGRIAHSIKGTSGQPGGQRLASSCDRLERKATAGCPSDGQTDLQEVAGDYQELRRALTRQLSPDRQLPSRPRT